MAEEQPQVLQLDITGAIRGGATVNDIVKDLSDKQGFDYEGASTAIMEDYKQRLEQDGVSYSPVKLREFADEEILVELSNGQIAREDMPKVRGAVKGLVVDVPAGVGFLKGAQTVFQYTPGPLPAKLVGGLAGGITGAALGYAPGEYIFNKYLYPQEALPSQRPEIEASRTFSGTLIPMLAARKVFADATVDLGGELLKRNADAMTKGWRKGLARAQEMGVRGLESISRAVKRPLPEATTKLGTASNVIKAAGLSSLPTTGAYVAETLDPGDPFSRFVGEMGASVMPVGRLASALSGGAASKLADIMSSLTTEGRRSAAGERLSEALSDLAQRYNVEGGYDPVEFRALLDEALNDPDIDQLVREINQGLPESSQLTRPELTVAQLTGIDLLDAMERGLRRASNKGDGPGFAEQSAQRFNEFKVFSRRVMEELLKRGQNDPTALKEAAEIQEALMREMLLMRVEAAERSATSLSQRVQPEQRRITASSQLVNNLRNAYDEASEIGSRLYERETENLRSILLPPEFTLDAIRGLQEVRSELPPVINKLLREITEESDEAFGAVSRLQRQVEGEIENVDSLSRSTRNYLSGHPEVRNALNAEEGVLERIQSYAQNSPLEAKQLVENLLENYTAREGSEVNRSVKAYLRKLLPELDARAELNQLQTAFNAARNEQSRLEGTAIETSMPILIDFKRQLGLLQRQLAPDPNNAQRVYDLGEIEDALVRDMESLVEQSSGSVDVLQGLREANAFHRAKHDVFTRTFAGEARAKNSRGAAKVDPSLYAERLMRGSGDEVSLKMRQVEDAVNFINAEQFQGPRQALSPEELSQLQESAVNRLGTHNAARLDVLKSFARDAIDQNPDSPTFNQVDPGKAQRFISKYEEALGGLFPAVFKDLREASRGTLSVKSLQDEINSIEKTLTETSELFRFINAEDTPGKIVGGILGSPGSRPPNVVKHFNRLIDDLQKTSQREGFSPERAQRALAESVLDRAWIYAGGANPENPFNFTRFREFLFRPLNDKDGPSVMTLLREKGLMTEELFRDYDRLLRQSDTIAKVMRKEGPALPEQLVDKGALMSNIVVRALGAVIGNVGLKQLEKVIGKVPGATFSVAGTTSSAAAELGLNMPNAKIRDVYVEAFSNPELLKVLLRPAPRTKKQAREYVRDVPFIFYTSVMRMSPEEAAEAAKLQQPEGSIEVPLRQSPTQTQVPFRPTPEEQRLQEEDVRRQRMQEPRPTAQMSRPTAQMQLPPLPQPQAAAPAAAPNPQARQQYAALFPNEGVSQMIKGGIGSLG